LSKTKVVSAVCEFESVFEIEENASNPNKKLSDKSILRRDVLYCAMASKIVEQFFEDILVPPNSSVKREEFLDRNFPIYSEISKDTDEDELPLLEEEKSGFLLRP
jgi:hypothetical protein